MRLALHRLPKEIQDCLSNFSAAYGGIRRIECRMDYVEITTAFCGLGRRMIEALSFERVIHLGISDDLYNGHPTITIWVRLRRDEILPPRKMKPRRRS